MSGSEGEHRKLMAGQLGVWFAQQLSPDDPVYNIGEYLEINGDLDVDLLEVALRHTVSEVEAFHLRFCGDGEALRRFVARSGDWPLHVIDVSSAVDPRAAAEDWMWADMRRPVALREGPLFAHAVFKVGPGRFFWYQRCHHIALDGLSGRIIAARQAPVYTSLLAGRPASGGPLEPVSVLIDADSSYRASAHFEHDREFWRDVLSDFPDVASISGRQVPRARGMSVRQMKDIDSGSAADLRVTVRRLRTNVAGLMIAAAAIYLHRTTGADDIVLGVPVLGRTGTRQREIPGMTSNILPIRLMVCRGTSLEELVRQTSKTVRNALRHQRYQHVDIRKDLRLVDGGSLFGLIINVMSFDYTIQFGDCTAISHNLSNGPVDDVEISVYDRSADGSLQVAFDVNPDLYSAESGKDIARRFESILNWVRVASPADYVGQAGVLDEGERERILAGWNDTAVPVPAVTVAGLFEARAARCPDAVAVVSGDAWVSYGELEERAGRLAHYLRAVGAGAESVVGLCLERGPEMITAVLAVWKAGAASLPLDPDYPVERLAFMLADSQVSVVVSHRPPAAGLPSGHAGDLPAGAGVVWLDDPVVVAAVAAMPPGVPAVAVAAGQLAYVMYTSGSTGQP